MKVNTTFYKSTKPDNEIEDDNLRGKRMLSSAKKQRCATESCAS